jgi:type II secretory ATPase GspE/PulE/Tfp pilus assembly ATPase PilB-like protein
VIPHANATRDRSLRLAEMSPEDGVAVLVERVVELQASDLFFTTFPEEMRVSARALGIVQPLAVLTPDQGRRYVSHIKAMAHMDVAERRRPLDGRWLVDPDGATGKLDLRINTLPTLHGEDCALRILWSEALLRDLQSLGMMRAQYNALIHPLSAPGGLVLVTGPTGSGKTTTLYSCLHYLNDGKRKISTIEDPIEFAVEGFQQTQVNARLDIDFPELLRGVLRQSPDIIMVGEIRDEVTAATAVRAANSGHLVFATLHAPVAAGAISVMLSLGVNPHFLATSLKAVISQRLVRVLCEKCRMAIDLAGCPYTFEDVEQWVDLGDERTIFTAAGCEACEGSGFVSRTGVFEVFTVNAPMRELIAAQATAADIQQAARNAGMIDFRRAALVTVARGVTSIEEALRLVPMEDLS